MKKNEYTKEQISAVKNVTDSWIPMSVCSYARALTKGMPVNHSDVSNYMKTLPGVGSDKLKDADAYVIDKLETIIEMGMVNKEAKEEVAKAKDAPRPSIQQLLRDKAMEMSIAKVSALGTYSLLGKSNRIERSFGLNCKGSPQYPKN